MINFILNPLVMAAQSFPVKKNYIGIEGTFEIGVKGYPGIKYRSSDLDNHVSIGGGFGVGMNIGRMISKKLQVKSSFYYQNSPQGTVMAEHDTSVRFSRININPSLKYCIPLNKSERFRWYAGVGAVIGVMAKMNESSTTTNYRSEVKYKPTLGPMVESGLEIFITSKCLIDVGLRFHYMKYSISSYSENDNTMPIDTIPLDAGLNRINASGGGYYISFKYLF